jgi:hypothetical protein
MSTSGQVRLVWLPGNRVWAYVFVDSLLRLPGEEGLFEHRHQAVAAAHRCRLAVEEDGRVALPSVASA